MRAQMFHRALLGVRLIVVTVVSVLLGASVAQAHTLGFGSWTTVASGLDNPRGLALVGDDRLIVAESGHAGETCPPVLQFCFGFTSQVSSVDVRTGVHTPVATGLPSEFSPFEAFGLGGVSAQDGHVFAVTAQNPQFVGRPTDACVGAPPGCIGAVSAFKAESGLLIKVGAKDSNQQHGDHRGQPQSLAGWTAVAGVGAYDYQWVLDHHPDPNNPDYRPSDANPYGVLAVPGGAYIADGGANTLSFARNDGTVTVLAQLPDPPNHLPIYDAVPTCVAKVHRSIYVGDLNGELYRWDGTALTKVLSGGKLTAITGCTSDRAGNLYLVNLTQQFNNFDPQPNSGSIVKVGPDLSTSYVVRPDQGLNFPNSIALGPDRVLFVSINSVCPADLSLLATAGVPPDRCPAAGQIVRLARRSDH
jgi:hypothetical protein